MDVFVEQPVVQQPVAVVEPDVVAEHADLGIELDISRYDVDTMKDGEMWRVLCFRFQDRGCGGNTDCTRNKIANFISSGSRLNFPTS